MRLFALIVGLVAVTASQAATDLATICAKASDAPKSEDGKDVYTHLCQLHLELLEVEEALQQLVVERDPAAEEDTVFPIEVESSHAADKRKNEFIRFGKRKNEFIRFGKRKNEFIRFGKRKNEFIRFGKRKNEFIRFGKRSKDEYIRFGRASNDQEPMENNEMTKRKNEFIRFG